MPEREIPRLFWLVALSFATLLALILLASPLAAMFSRGSTCYNEGFDAYYTRDAIQGKALYATRPGLTSDNYPPLSFYLIGWVSPKGGENQAGRWVALVAFLLVVSLCGLIVHQLTHSLPLGVYVALSLVIWLAVYKSDRIGMNDPQLLGSVFNLLGLYIYIRRPEHRAFLLFSALAFVTSLFIKHNLVAFPIAVALHLLLRRNWKGFAVWCGTATVASAGMLFAIQKVEGPYFLANLLMPRTQFGWLTHITDFAMVFQVAFVVAIFWAYFQRPATHIMTICAALAFMVAVGFAGGDGVDRNIFFDSLFSLAMIGALCFAEFSHVFSGKWRLILLAALLLFPSTGIFIQLPLRLRLELQEFGSIRRRAEDFEITVESLRSRPGPALCEDLLACFEAGKSFDYDPFAVINQIKVGRLSDHDVAALIENKYFSSVQLNGIDLSPGDRPHFSKAFMQALLNRYRVEKKLSGSVILVPQL